MSWEADILALTYEDTMTVSRTEKVIDEDSGITSRKLIVISSNIPCSLSKKEIAVTDGDTNNIVSKELVFCRPEINVKTDDILTITRCGDTKTYRVGQSFDYVSHKEIAVKYMERV